MWESGENFNLSGIFRVDDLYQNCVFMSYTDLTRRYALTGKGRFWKYLQIRSCLAQRTQYKDRNPVPDFLRLPTEHLKASIFYRLSNEILSNSCDSLKRVWQKDLGCMLNEEEWLNILSHHGKFVRESRSKFTQYKIIHRYYWTPSRLHRTGLSNNNLCWKERKRNFFYIVFGTVHLFNPSGAKFSDV